MSPHPAFQRGVGYGDRFDDRIRAGLAEGLSPTEISRRIGIASWFVCGRARALGYSRNAKRPLTRRLNIDLTRPVRAPSNPSRVVAATITHRPDDSTSRLARALRQRPIILDRDGLDPSHGVACLHLAGLTLPEIEGVTGYPASAVVAAVRAHCAPLGAAR